MRIYFRKLRYPPLLKEALASVCPPQNVANIPLRPFFWLSLIV
jgi:hypothetical protein